MYPENDELTSELYRQIGRLNVELDRPKKTRKSSDEEEGALIDRQYTKRPFCGVPRNTHALKNNWESMKPLCSI